MVSATALIVPEKHAPFQVAEVQLDALRPDEVSVGLKATSICATDVAVQHEKFRSHSPLSLGTKVCQSQISWVVHSADGS